MLSLGVLCWSFVAWLELAALGFRGEGFRRYLCYRLSLEVGFCVSLVVRPSAGGGACGGALSVLCLCVSWWSLIGVLPAFSGCLLRAVSREHSAAASDGWLPV